MFSWLMINLKYKILISNFIKYPKETAISDIQLMLNIAFHQTTTFTKEKLLQILLYIMTNYEMDNKRTCESRQNRMSLAYKEFCR